jgi:predicted dehydrogenase
MKTLLRDTRNGEVILTEVPPPELLPESILVQTHFSAISTGTELASVSSAQKSLGARAAERPDLVRQVWQYARNHGVRAAYQKVQAKLNTLIPLGYSCSGTVLKVASGVTEFEPGDRVACAGGGYAMHGEINVIPRNLAVHVPNSVGLESASLVAIGAIAVQGLRQAGVSFGESVAVIGIGLVGSLTVQIARAAGCRVVAIDADPGRSRRATEFGALLSLTAGDAALLKDIRSFTGKGIDSVIVTAATDSAEPVELATSIARDRGRIVVVGDVGMSVSRTNFYGKELSIVASRSYGPGRYDPVYEEGGVDYPAGYVRWTEGRNMQTFVDLLESNSINVNSLLDYCPLQQAAQAYVGLKQRESLTTIIRYDVDQAARVPVQPGVNQIQERPRRPGKIRVGCIGAGSFAQDVVFPVLRGLENVELGSVAATKGAGAESARRIFGFQAAQSPQQLVEDNQIDAVFILTRHATHAKYVAESLARGKAVFVEKPLGVTRADLAQIREAYEQRLEKNHTPFLMVGFNRRFAPFTVRIKEFLADRLEPMVVHLRVNAGFVPADHWSQQSQNGGRIVGELCHFIDWARYLAGSPIANISASGMADAGRYQQDNVAVVIKFEDGSLANLLYLANGDPKLPKEYAEIFCQGRVIRLEDFVSLELIKGGKRQAVKAQQDKGHRRQFECMLDAVAHGLQSPVPFAELMEVSEAAITVKERLGLLGGEVAPDLARIPAEAHSLT